MAHITVSPKCALVDELLEIVVQGTLPGQKISVTAEITEGGQCFFSCAHYISDERGEANLALLNSLGGSYTGVMPMGLFSSLVAMHGKTNNQLLIQKDTSEPLTFCLKVFDGFLRLEELCNNKKLPIATTAVKRWYRSIGVTSIDIRDGSLRGKLFLPKGPGPFLGVIDLFGIHGLVEHRAALFASRGFACLALAYVGYDDLPRDYQIKLEYFEEAIEFMTHHPKVTPGGVGIHATSFGGEIALEIASYCGNKDKVKALVCVNPYIRSTTFVSYRGQHLPNYLVMEDYKIAHYKDGFAYEYLDLQNQISTEKIIPINKASAQLLFVIGGDDKTVPCARNAEVLTLLMDKHKKRNYEILYYPGAGHMIDPPHSPLFCSSWYPPAEMVMVHGGKLKEHAFAQEDSWRKILQFFLATLCKD